MAKDKPLTKSDLVAALKEAREATKADVKSAIEASERRLTKHITDVVAGSNEAVRAGVEGLHKEVIDRLDTLELDAPTRQEFEALKGKVKRYHPPN